MVVRIGLGVKNHKTEREKKLERREKTWSRWVTKP